MVGSLLSQVLIIVAFFDVVTALQDQWKTTLLLRAKNALKVKEDEDDLT